MQPVCVGSPPWDRAVLYMAATGAFFYASYSLTNWAAAQRTFVPSIAFGWETHIPFLAWTIVPYWSLNLFYIASFFVCRTHEELRLHALRVMAAQTISAAVFLLYPLRFGFPRPEEHGLFAAMFTALESFDQPFNQAPSLHISLAVIVAARFAVHLDGMRRRILYMWFVLIGVSALTTYQHHFADIPTGAWLGLACCALIPDSPVRALDQGRQPILGTAYLAGFAVLAASAWSIDGWALWLLWPAGSCLILAAVYFLGRPTMFQKWNGSPPRAMRWLLAPYLAVVRLNAWGWTRREPLANEIASGVWLGRLPAHSGRFCSIVDLTAELPATPGDSAYENIPVLDLAVPTAAQIARAVAAIELFSDRRPTLVCCALGYSRSAAAVAAWLTATGRLAKVDEAIAEIQQRRSRVVLGAAHRARLAEWAGERIAPQATAASRLVARALVLTARAVVGAEARWVGCRPTRAQRIYVANHTSHADFVVLWSALPGELRELTHPVAAADYWKASRLRRYLAERVFGSVLIERDHVDRAHNPVHAMRLAINQGKSLILFPEGTRGPGGEPGEFKCGIYHLARQCPDVEFVPVWIANLDRVLPKGSLVPVPLLCSITFGEPTHLREGEDKQMFLARLRQAVIATGGACLPTTKSC